MCSSFALRVVLAAGIASAFPAFAEDALTARVGVTGGGYSFQDQFTDKDGGAVDSTQDRDSMFGLLGGMRYVSGAFLADLGLEFSRYAEGRRVEGAGEDSRRSDGLLTVGASIGHGWIAFAGYRHAVLGEGFFVPGRSGVTQAGPFFGGGAALRAANRFSLGMSLAYNLLEVRLKRGTIGEVDVRGLSAKLQLNVLRTPHSFFLRYQRFNGDRRGTEPRNFEYDYDEASIHVGYQVSFLLDD